MAIHNRLDVMRYIANMCSESVMKAELLECNLTQIAVISLCSDYSAVWGLINFMRVFCTMEAVVNTKLLKQPSRLYIQQVG